jgi:hypothetical protein
MLIVSPWRLNGKQIGKRNGKQKGQTARRACRGVRLPE